MKHIPAILLIGVAILFSGAAQAGSVQIPSVVGGAFSVPAISLKEARYRATIRQQYDFSCGSAALATLLTHHYRYPVTEETVFQEMYQLGDQAKIQREGFSLLDMKLFLERRGFAADAFEEPLDKLAAAGIPAIVLIKENGYFHFVIIKGIRDQRVLIGDPSAGTRAVTRNEFESLWVNRTLFVIYNNQNIAAFNTATDWHVAPRAPLASGVNRSGLGNVVLPKLGPGDF